MSNNTYKPSQLLVVMVAFLLYAPVIGLLAFKEIIGPITALILIGAFFVGAWAALQELAARPRSRRALAVIGVVGFCLGALCAAIEQITLYLLFR